MKKQIIAMAAIAIIATSATFTIRATAQPIELVKDELGVTRMKAAYPEPDSRIPEGQFVIAGDFTGLEIPIDLTTVVIIINGIDATPVSEVTTSYFMYQSEYPLPAGEYEVRVTAKDVKHNPLQALSWIFRVGTGAPGVRPAPPIEIAKDDNTEGSLKVSTDYVSASYISQPTINVSNNFQEKEGMKINADFTSTNTSEGRTLTTAYHRETLSGSDTEIDKFKLLYSDDKVNASFGSFRMKFSELSVMGTELNGFKTDKVKGALSTTIFSGRTQDPSTSGTYKQIASGIRSGWTWNQKNKTTATALIAREKGESVDPTRKPPFQDNIITLLHEYKHSSAITATLEAAANTRRSIGSVAKANEAMRATLASKHKKDNTKLEYYHIPLDYLPISEGASRLLRSNRRGFAGDTSRTISKRLTIGGGYEQYASFDEAAKRDINTRKENLSTTLSPGGFPKLTWRKSRLTTSNGTVTNNDTFISIYTLPDGRIFKSTRISANANKTSYLAQVSNITINSKTNGWGTSFNTTFKETLKLNASYSFSKTDNKNTDAAGVPTISYNTNTNYSYGFNWDAIEDKLSIGSKIETAKTGGSSASTKETRLKNLLTYTINEIYGYTFGWDIVNYKDANGPQWNYKQNIARTGLEWNF